MYYISENFNLKEFDQELVKSQSKFTLFNYSVVDMKKQISSKQFDWGN